MLTAWIAQDISAMLLPWWHGGQDTRLYGCFHLSSSSRRTPVVSGRNSQLTYTYMKQYVERLPTNDVKDPSRDMPAFHPPVQLVKGHAGGVWQEQPTHKRADQAKRGRQQEGGALVNVAKSHVSNDRSNLARSGTDALECCPHIRREHLSCSAKEQADIIQNIVTSDPCLRR